jgi:hypothetical protein
VLFRSSPIAIRSHCGACGTPLYLVNDGKDEFGLSAGNLENPEEVTPTYHYESEGKLSWADLGASLPSEETKERW